MRLVLRDGSIPLLVACMTGPSSTGLQTNLATCAPIWTGENELCECRAYDDAEKRACDNTKSNALRLLVVEFHVAECSLDSLG